ncbi:hypothetical protein, conserved [Plasmodium vivax]|nr:hypothetical protein, conserved [Plasmodium vivax]
MYKFKTVFSGIRSIYEDDFENDLDEYEQQCNKVIQGNSIIENTFGTNCKKCMKYLDYLERQFYTQNQETAQVMLYLYCWLYDKELYNENYSKKELEIYKDLIVKHDEVSSNLPQIFRENVDEKHIDKLKELYDLYYKFDKFKHNINCSGDYCSCAKECYISYNNYTKDCNKSDNVDFCNGLEEFRAQYNNYMSNSSKCNGEYKYLPPAIKFDISVILIPIIATLIISSILLFLYKFTPLGSLMCPSSKNKYKMKNIIGEEMYDTIHHSRMSNIGLNQNPYTVAYHSMEHT